MCGVNAEYHYSPGVCKDWNKYTWVWFLVGLWDEVWVWIGVRVWVGVWGLLFSSKSVRLPRILWVASDFAADEGVMCLPLCCNVPLSKNAFLFPQAISGYGRGYTLTEWNTTYMTHHDEQICLPANLLIWNICFPLPSPIIKSEFPEDLVGETNPHNVVLG